VVVVLLVVLRCVDDNDGQGDDADNDYDDNDNNEIWNELYRITFAHSEAASFQ